jgi:hypothetical protein
MLALGATMIALAGCAANRGSADAYPGGSSGLQSPGANQALSPTDTLNRPKQQANLPPGQQSALASLKGLTPPELRAALGEPALLHRDGTAELWQYAGSGCVLHIFLYQDNGAFHVNYAEVRVDNPALVNPPTCVDRLPNTSAQVLTPVSAH